MYGRVKIYLGYRSEKNRLIVLKQDELKFINSRPESNETIWKYV